MQDNMKHNNIHIIGIPKGEEEQEIENLFEKIMMENFPTLMRQKVTQIQETQSPNQDEPKESHFKTQHNLNDNITRQGTNLKDSKGETGSNMQGGPDMVSN